jgi:hypothetical protein
MKGTKLFDRFENIPPIIRNVVPLQKLDVFLAERFPAVMFFLAANVADDGIQMRMRDGKSPKTLLP